MNAASLQSGVHLSRIDGGAELGIARLYGRAQATDWQRPPGGARRDGVAGRGASGVQFSDQARDLGQLGLLRPGKRQANRPAVTGNQNVTVTGQGQQPRDRDWPLQGEAVGAVGRRAGFLD